MASSQKTIRLEISLSPSHRRDPVVINYHELIEKKIGELAPLCEGESLSANAGDRSLCSPPAKQQRKKHRMWDFPDFRALGSGYIEDSFIDNTETCDESIVSTSQIKFHIRSKVDLTDSESDFETSSDTFKGFSECESDQSVVILSQPKATKSQKNFSPPKEPASSPISEDLSKIMWQVLAASKPPTPPHLPAVIDKCLKEMDPPCKISALSSTISKKSTGGIVRKRLPVKAQLPKKTGKVQPPKKAEVSSSTASLAVAKCSKVCTAAAEPSTPGAERPSRPLATSRGEEHSTHPSPDSSSNGHTSIADTAFLAQEPELPDSVLTLLEIVTATNPANMKKIVHEANGEVLLKLSEECRLLPPTTRMHVYEQVAQHWNCAANTVSRRFGRIKAHLDEQPVRENLVRLRSKMRKALANVAGNGGALHEFTAADSDLLHDTLVAKVRWLEQHPPRKGSVREALQRFIDAKILPLWAAYGSRAYSSAVFVVREEMRRLFATPAAFPPSIAPSTSRTSTPNPAPAAQRKKSTSAETKSRKSKKSETH